MPLVEGVSIAYKCGNVVYGSTNDGDAIVRLRINGPSPGVPCTEGCDRRQSGGRCYIETNSPVYDPNNPPTYCSPTETVHGWAPRGVVSAWECAFLFWPSGSDMGQMPLIGPSWRDVPMPRVEVVCDEETGQFKIYIGLRLRTGLAGYPQTYRFENVPLAPHDGSSGVGRPRGWCWEPASNLVVDENGYLVGTVDLSLSPRWTYPPEGPPIPPPASIQGITWNCTVHFYPRRSR